MTGLGIWPNADRQYLHKVRAGYESGPLFKTLMPSLLKEMNHFESPEIVSENIELDLQFDFLRSVALLG